MRFVLTPAKQADTRFTYPGGMEGWVDLGGWLYTDMVYVPADSHPSRLAMYTVSQKKRHPFYICYNLIRCHPILSILGRNILQEICNKHSCTAHHTSFHMFVLYLVKSSNDFYGIQ